MAFCNIPCSHSLGYNDDSVLYVGLGSADPTSHLSCTAQCKPFHHRLGLGKHLQISYSIY